MNEDGIGLIEVMAALAITIVVITALVSLALYTTRSSLQSKLALEATNLAIQEKEIVRALRDSSATWNDFKTTLTAPGKNCTVPATGCYINFDSINSTFIITSGKEHLTIDNQNMYRNITITFDPTEDKATMASHVEWAVGGKTERTDIYTTLTNWQNK